MKKIFALSLATLLALGMMGCSKGDSTALGDNDEEFVIEDDVQSLGSFEYSVNESGNYEIVGYTYDGTDLHKVEIPSEIEGRPVSGIGADAFKAVSTINEVVIPDSVTYIGQFAFWGCKELTTINLNNITNIGIGAFQECAKLSGITFSDKLTSIGDYAFWNCAAIAAVDFPEALETIGEGAFWGCEALTKVEIPAAVKDVGRAAFMYCSKLAEVNVLGAETDIGLKAFDACAEGIVVTVPTPAEPEGNE